MKSSLLLVTPISWGLLIANAIVGRAATDSYPGSGWARVIEDQDRIKIITDKLEAAIPKKNPKHWMTGIEKGSFLDRATGFREVGDGLMVVDWLMEAGSDRNYGDQVVAPDGHGVGRYTWYENETDPARRTYALMAHGSSHRKRMESTRINSECRFRAGAFHSLTGLPGRSL